MKLCLRSVNDGGNYQENNFECAGGIVPDIWVFSNIGYSFYVCVYVCERIWVETSGTTLDRVF